VVLEATASQVQFHTNQVLHQVVFPSVPAATPETAKTNSWMMHYDLSEYYSHLRNIAQVFLILNSFSLPLQVVIKRLSFLHFKRSCRLATHADSTKQNKTKQKNCLTWIRARIAWLSAVILNNSRRL